VFKFDKNTGLTFRAKDLKEVYEPIVTQFGFEYDATLDRKKRGLVWSKCYVADAYAENLWPVMVIRETGNDIFPDSKEATYFSTSLYFEDWPSGGFTIGVNPDEFEYDNSGDETEALFELITYAKEEVNNVLECCRQQLAAKLTSIQDKLIAESNEEDE
jgi:hypothetical protein